MKAMYPIQILEENHVIDEPDYVIYRLTTEPKFQPWKILISLVAFLSDWLPIMSPWSEELWYLVATPTRGTIVRLDIEPRIRERITVPEWNPQWMERFDTVVIDGQRFSNTWDTPIRSSDFLE
ncbi:MAG: hypothetical protein LBG99_01240 [Propionibacteriaceae bacterium]|jgi:hypothetical protein|nr:hypothetical protein [Propionibacteriaceae bacterium]